MAKNAGILDRVVPFILGSGPAFFIKKRIIVASRTFIYTEIKREQGGVPCSSLSIDSPMMRSGSS